MSDATTNFTKPLRDKASRTFGEAVRRAREERGWSQRELASRVLKEDGKPITPQYLNDIEHDRRSPTGDRMVTALAEALVAQADYFFVMAGRLPPNDARLASCADAPEAMAALAAFRAALRGADA